MRYLMTVLCASLLALGCHEPAAPLAGAGDYGLARVAGDALPRMVPLVSGYATAFHVTAGRLTLGPDRSFTLTLDADMFQTATNSYAAGNFVVTCRGAVDVLGAWLWLKPDASSDCHDTMEALVDARTGQVGVGFAKGVAMDFESAAAR